MDRIELDYTLTLDEVAEGIAPAIRGRVIATRLVLAAACVLPLVNVWLRRHEPNASITSLPWIFLAAFMAFSLFRSRRMGRDMYKRVYNESVTFQSPIRAILDDTGVVIENYYVSSRSRWERFTHWKETANLIVLYEGRIAQALPKRALATPEQIEGLRDLCRRHVHHQTYRPPVRAFPIESPPA